MVEYTKLTSEQISLAAQYREKWQLIATSVERIDQGICTGLINRLYQEVDAQEPEILFFESPYAALKECGELIQKAPSIYDAITGFERKIEKEIYSGFKFSPLTWNDLEKLRNPEDISQWMSVNYSIMGQLNITFKKISPSINCHWFRPSENISGGTCSYDFLISTLNLNISMG
jgi:hypothetical protein